MTTYTDENDDSSLVQLAREGDHDAFAALYERYSRFVFSTALKLLADPIEACEVQQQVFLKLYTKAFLYKPEKGKLATWLATITRNYSIDRLRQMKRRRSLIEKLCIETTAAVESTNPNEGCGH